MSETRVTGGPTEPSRVIPRLQLVGAALLFSTAGAAIKGLELSAWQVTSARSAIAAIALVLFLPSARGGWTWGSSSVGLAYAITMICFVAANKMTTAANAVFLQATAPLYIMLLGPWLLRERARLHDAVLMVVMAAGLGLFFVGGHQSGATTPAPLLGNTLAALSGASWALALMGFRLLARGAAPLRAREGGAGVGSETDGAMVAVVAGNVFAAVLCAPFGWPFDGIGTGEWLMLTYLGVFQIGLAYVFLVPGMRRVPALEASLLMLVEEAVNPLWVWILHEEVPRGWSILGGGIIMAATGVKAWLDAPRRPAQNLAEAGIPGD